ncbi:MAG TPA: PAS domain-containing protein [Chitinophagaceae bacterium]|jgi:PAS domain S-box-containing protein
MDTSEFFDSFYNNAKENSVIIMDTEGFILKVNDAFTIAFGYNNDEVAEKNFSLFFTDEDKKAGKPKIELQRVKSYGFASDDNYLVHKDGTPIWTSGESVFVRTSKEENYVVKVVQNIHAQKQLEGFLTESNEFIDTIFESIRDAGLVVLDSLMRIVKVNSAFIKMFEIEAPLREGNRLIDLDHPFWKRDDIKKDIRSIIVTNRSFKEEQFQMETKSGKTKTITFRSKSIYTEPGMEREILILIKEKPAH